MNNSTVLNTVFSAIGGAIVGSAITFIVTKKHLREEAQKEVAEVRETYRALRQQDNAVNIYPSLPNEDAAIEVNAEDIPGTPEQYQKAKQMVEELGYRVPDDPRPEARSIFEHEASPEEVGPRLTGPNGMPIEDETEEQSAMRKYVRLSGKPYIISKKEFFETETDWEKPTLTYYEGDDTLTGIDEQIRSNREELIGSRHLSMFGILSEDVDVVYVRNPQLSADFEVVHRDSKYSVEILGEPDHEEEEEKPRLRKMRSRDA